MIEIKYLWGVHTMDESNTFSARNKRNDKMKSEDQKLSVTFCRFLVVICLDVDLMIK